MLFTLSLLGLALSAQNPAQRQPGADGGAKPATHTVSVTDSGVYATRAERAPAIDGKDDDAVWRTAPVISAFRQWQPTEDAEPRFRTEAKVAYDAANMYVFVRAFDAHPDSIIRLLERRDTFTPSDMIWILVDSYHDRRNGYEFGVNAAGVKIDQAIYDDREDGAWDAVWDVATTIDSLGWTAEFRIPLSQMRYSQDPLHTFGLTILRDLYRYNERESWPLLRQSKPGLVRQFGSLYDIDTLETPRRLEAMPYLVTKREPRVLPNAFTNRSSATLGGDFKYRIASNLTIDATANPDFGQVESDPAVLNLTAYESFFDERRPFFVAGRGLFRFDVNCSEVNCNNEGLYYSRRIGRTPELGGVYGASGSLHPTTIIGAAKLIGRFPSGLTVGLLDATTERARGGADTTLEPATNFAALRVKQDLRGGNSGFGAMLTAVNRDVDRWSSPYLNANAYAGAVDFRHRILQNTYEITGSLDASRVEGSRSAMLLTQTDGVHGYQRPDAGLPLDSNRTTLDGDAEEIAIEKIGGKHLMFQSALQRHSSGFDVNDLGYLRRADQTTWNTWVGFFDRTKRSWYNRFQWNNNWWQYWTTSGLPLEAAYNTNFHITLKNNAGLHFGGTIGQLGTTYDDRGARGGPAIRQDSYFAPWAFISGDDRHSVVPSVSLNWNRSNEGRSRATSVSPEIDWKAHGRFSSAFSLGWSHAINNDQWFGSFSDAAAATHYTFAHLDQTTTSATVRLNYTFTPNVSLQVYMQPFVSKGTYTDVRQLSATPRAANYDARYATYGDTSVTNNPGGFNFKEFQSNVVFRWEYQPGSTLFVVWNEGRQGYGSAAGNDSFGGDVRNLMRLHPANTLLVKLSYWLNR